MADNYFNINTSTGTSYQIGLPLESSGSGTVGKFWTKKKRVKLVQYLDTI